MFYLTIGIFSLLFTTSEVSGFCRSGKCRHSSETVHYSLGLTLCRCHAGYTGGCCESDIDECASNPCLHGGKCRDGSNSYSCDCPSGYSGVHCETITDLCVSSPCQHNGKCTKLVNSYSCSCPQGYAGKNCEQDVDECSSNPCRHSGTCVDHENSYTCVCQHGYTGLNCQTNVECHSHPCVNGGICTDDQQDGYLCHCPLGYSGSNCQIEPLITSAPVVRLDSEKTVFEGSAKEIIPCFADGIPDPVFTWEALDGKLPPNAKQITHYLYFENVTLANEGNYMCTAKNVKGMDVKVIHITVEAKAEKQHTTPVITAPSTIMAQYYTTTVLTCNVTGYPKPTIVWQHDNRELRVTGNIYVIPNVTNTTSGLYTCIAKNDAGVSKANINVMFTYDAPKIVSPPSSSISKAGQSHNFTCVATGHPIPKITWEFNSFSSHSTAMPTHNMSKNGTILTLMKMQESGTLTCKAVNRFGVDKATVHVIVRHDSPAVG